MSSEDILNVQETYDESDFDETGPYQAAEDGFHLVRVLSVDGEPFNYKKYTGTRAVVKFEVDDVADNSNGCKIMDWINLPHPMEKPGNKKRRAVIAKRLGLAKGAGSANFNFGDLAGMEIAVYTEQSTTEKDGKKRTYANVTFDGYYSREDDRIHGGSGDDGDDDFSNV